MKKIMMIVAMIAGMGMMLGLVGCGGKSESEIKADIEKTAIENVQKMYRQMLGADEVTYSVEKCVVNGDKAECTVVCKNKEGETIGNAIVMLTKRGDNWSVSGMSSFGPTSK